MFKFIAKRLGISAVIMLISSAIMYILTINSGDPLKDLRESTDPNRDNLIAQRTQWMGLDQPWYTRYWDWLTGVGGCFKGQCDLGINRSGQSVNHMLGLAVSSTMRLVVLATVLAIVLGIFFGMMTAIRQYSGFDYTVTFAAFVFYSLPAFVFAVLLKEYGAIRFNNWLRDPTISLVTSLIIAALFALFIQAMLSGNKKRRLISFGVTFAVLVAVLQFMSATGFMNDPTIGIWLPLGVGVVAAILFTSLFTGTSNKRTLYNTLGSAVIAVLLLQIFEGQLWEPTWGFLFILLVGFVAIAVALGYFTGGYARRSVIWANVWTVCSVWMACLMDFMMRYWSDYTSLSSGRPISTIGSETPNFRGGDVFWLQFTDVATHLLLPTISLTLMSIASYTRYTRSAMLEVLNQDYMRTARAKGLPEHTVITRHAFRNAMIPITTIIAFDFAGLIGGAVITETVFGWKGMGNMFKVALDQVDPAPVMAFFLVTGGAAILMNMLADITYAYIDPRIRR
ncbi:MAG: ABC transporter permease subunit [Ancrocorticia populi]|uniref:ABC transporter permease n=1 Tax=Ancrocorticia populi TaxID=2175228 RepID=UPI003F8EA786